MRPRLGLAPRPIAKCAAPQLQPDRPYPTVEGVEVRKAGIEGRWLIETTIDGRTYSINVSTSNLEKILTDGRRKLAAEGVK